jgi:hypothetical protein
MGQEHQAKGLRSAAVWWVSIHQVATREMAMPASVAALMRQVQRRATWARAYQKISHSHALVACAVGT